jgi:hypothetical protein
MRLRTNQVFMRFSWAGNVLARDGHFELIEEAEELVGSDFDLIANIARQTGYRERTFEREAEWIPTFPDDEAHPILHVGLKREGDEPAEQMSIFAGPHPYTGRYVVQYELLLDRERFEDDAFTERCVELFKDYASKWDPICGHMHDADDNSIQNTASASMLKLGFGVEVDEVNLAENPGREVSRGEFRFAVNWLSFFGEEMVARLERYMDDDPPEQVEKFASGWFIRLYDSPFNPAGDDHRERQREIRKSLAMKEATAENARAFGFWQRKG